MGTPGGLLEQLAYRNGGSVRAPLISPIAFSLLEQVVTIKDAVALLDAAQESVAALDTSICRKSGTDAADHRSVRAGSPSGVHLQKGER